MVWVRMIKADNIFSALASAPLDADEFLRVDVIAVVRRVVASVAGPCDVGYGFRPAVCKLAEQHAAAFVRIGFFAVPAERSVDVAGNSEHENFRGQRSDCRGEKLND